MIAAIEAPTLMLPPVLDITAAAPLREQLLAFRGGSATLDASNVERVGGLCLQVLMAARKTWAADGAAFRIIAASQAFTDQVAGFGATELQHGTESPG